MNMHKAESKTARERFWWVPVVCASVAIVATLGRTPYTAKAQPVPEPEASELGNDSSTSAPEHVETVDLELAKPVDPAEMRKAARRAQEIQDEILRIDKEKGSYSDELVQKIADFYRFGGPQDDPADPTVVRIFCHEYVIFLLRDLLLIDPQKQRGTEPDPTRPQNPLNRESAERFHDLLAELLPTAPDDLSFIQRTRLYRLAGKVLNAEDHEALDALEALTSEQEFTKSERELVRYAIGRIEDRQPSNTAA